MPTRTVLAFLLGSLLLLQTGAAAPAPAPSEAAPDVSAPERTETGPARTLGAAVHLAGLEGVLRTLPVSAIADSVEEDLAVGRYWHATRVLRAGGAADGGPETLLVLAVAEAGWGHWTAVLDLLEEALWLPEVGDAAGLYLLGRALEAEERWAAAAAAFERYLDASSPEADARAAAVARGADALWRSGAREEALAWARDLTGTGPVSSWLAAGWVGEVAEAGDTVTLARVMPLVFDEAARSSVWRATADARLAAGDTVGAERRWEALARTARSNGEEARAAEATVSLARLRLAAGDSAAAWRMFGEALEGARGPARGAAAAGRLDAGDPGLDELLSLASILDRAGDGHRALRAYDNAWRIARGQEATLPDRARLERARLLATVRDRQPEALEEFRALRESVTDRELAARNLQIWRAMRQRQGLAAQVRTLERWLVEEYPESGAAAEIVFQRGFDAESAGRLNEALGHYEAVAGAARTHARAGQARMRSGQILLGRGALEDAARTFELYLEDFPRGRRWEEAAYWAGRVRIEMGEEDEGRRYLLRVMNEPVSYYAVMASGLLGTPHRVTVPEGGPPARPDWLERDLAGLDALVAAGLERGAEAHVERMSELARGDRATMLGLAEALIERGRTIDGINLGWALLEEAGGWDRRILTVTFPFPYRELVTREAEEWGIDPIMLAALIRQESAFKADIVSHAGAIGLMQVMPPTGAQLARAHGPERFSPDALRTPEINLHLGSAFLVDMTRRYDGALPLVLSAYNAGPSRANRWRRYPEASDELRFTERIPFVETRGYVKNVRRNLGLYRILYAEE